MRAAESGAEKALTDLSEEFAQATVDVIAADTVLEHIPTVKTLVAAGKVVSSIRDQILVRKLGKFLTGLADVPAEQRRSMITRLECDPDYSRKVGMHLIELLDRVDSHRKPAMLGAAFAAFARGEISAKLIQRLNDAIERLPSVEIDAVRRIASQSTAIMPDMGHDIVSLQALTNCGLATSQSAYGGLVYTRTEACEAFLRLELDRLR